MKNSLTLKRVYHKPKLNLVSVDYSISMQGTSPPGDPPLMMKNPNSSKDKNSSPFGGSKPNYK